MNMDPILINESSFSTVNPSSYSLAEIFRPFRHNPDASAVEESTLTQHSGGAARKRPPFSSEAQSSIIVCTTTTADADANANDLNDSNGKRIKTSGSSDEHVESKAEVEASSVITNKPAEQDIKPPEPPKQDYIHVRARRGQATDSHSLAERARREKLSERMKILQDLVPGCNKVIGKALVLDEIINYVQSLQCQVEFLSMKLEAVNSRMNIHPSIDGFPSKDLALHSFDAAGSIYGSQAKRESQPEWLHMQIGGSFGRST